MNVLFFKVKFTLAKCQIESQFLNKVRKFKIKMPAN